MSSVIDHVFSKSTERAVDFVIHIEISDYYMVGCNIQINTQINERDEYDAVVKECHEC